VTVSTGEQRETFLGKEDLMPALMQKLVIITAVAVIAAGCAVTEERSGPGADGVPVVAVACAEDHPDCEDTVVVGDLPTGGDDPLAPPDSGDASQSGGFVVGDGVSVADALAYEGTEVVAVHGFVVRTSAAALLCEVLAESFPPQCGGARLTITNPDATTGLILLEEGDVQWSPDAVVLLGHVSGDGFTIDDTVNA
jgi:hypothetical protein